MCRLLGVIANKVVEFEFSTKGFRELGKNNPDGWGIGWYERGEAKIFKEACSSKESKKYESACRKIKSHLIIEHVRLASCGNICEENSHPFTFHNWIFAHNGGVKKHKSLREKLVASYGENLGEDCTDSEIYFRFLVQNIEQIGDVEKGIRSGIQKICDECEHSGLNFLLSDRKKLYAYRNGRELFYLERNPEKLNKDEVYNTVSEETKLMIESKMLNHEKAVVVCSERISNEPGWVKMEDGQLLVIDSKLNIKPIIVP